MHAPRAISELYLLPYPTASTYLLGIGGLLYTSGSSFMAVGDLHRVATRVCHSAVAFTVVVMKRTVKPDWQPGCRYSIYDQESGGDSQRAQPQLRHMRTQCLFASRNWTGMTRATSPRTTLHLPE